ENCKHRQGEPGHFANQDLRGREFAGAVHRTVRPSAIGAAARQSIALWPRRVSGHIRQVQDGRSAVEYYPASLLVNSGRNPLSWWEGRRQKECAALNDASCPTNRLRARGVLQDRGGTVRLRHPPRTTNDTGNPRPRRNRSTGGRCWAGAAEHVHKPGI